MKSELLQENTGLKSENEELKNKLAQMEALIRSLQSAKETEALPLRSETDNSGADETKEEEVVTVTFQAHHMLRYFLVFLLFFVFPISFQRALQKNIYYVTGNITISVIFYSTMCTNKMI